jgi:membrane-bound ClpP family serine protease
VRFIISLLDSRSLGHIDQPAVSLIAARVGIYALAGTLAGAVASGMLLWVLLLL